MKARQPIKFATLVLCFTGCSAQLPENDAADFEGCWNVKESTQGMNEYSWIEVNRIDDGWEGLFLHRGGHPQPAEITIEGPRITVKRFPDTPAAASPDNPLPTLSGVWEAGRLSGTGTDREGDFFEWMAVRAPDRDDGSNREVTWGEPIELFNSKDLDGWVVLGDKPSYWRAVEGILSNEQSGANIRTTAEFRDFKLRLEFKIPEGSNSGIYLRGRYETQIQDLHGKAPHSRGVGGIYGHLTPTVNMVKQAGEWNVVEATLVGFRVTLLVNGETTIDGKLIPGITGGALDADESGPGPIMLQGDHGPVYFRNMILTPAY